MLSKDLLMKRREELVVALDQSAAHHNSLRGALTELDNLMVELDKMNANEANLMEHTPDKCA